MHKKLISVLLLATMLSGSAQAQRITDKLDRGLVAVQTTGGVYCSWRINAEEYYDVSYNIYRDGVLLNSTPLKVSNYTDAGGSASSTYTVKAVVRGKEQAASKAVGVLANAWKEIKPKHDASLKSTYIPNDACCADVDGDGEVEILLKYDNQSEINASYPRAGYNGEYSLFECLKQDGTVLWWVNCGPNMGDFQNNEQNIVAYDWDGDGKAEAVFRAADGTTIHMADGTTYVVGDASKNYRAATGGGTNWFMHEGAEYLLYVDGATGKPYQCVEYPLKRLESGETSLEKAWGDGYGHRSTKHFFGAPYLDGKKPSIFLGRGIYTRHKFIAYDVNPATHELVERWRWTNNQAGLPWYGQGYHNYCVADVDWDGRDEIVWGSMVIDDNGKGLSTTGLGHGDAQHVGDFNPYKHGQEFYACNEDLPDNNYRDATTSKIYYRQTSTNDDGRSLCGNFSNDFPGSIGKSGHDTPISTVTNGHVDGMTETGMTVNFRIYWDGDLCEEPVDGVNIYKYGIGLLQTLTGAYSNNGTKNTPCYQGDIFGDWREEVIMRTADNNIRIYTTTIPTENRNYSLWYDHQYRNAMVWQMCGYNQPPHASYFLGELEGITIAPPPLTTTGREEIANGGTISSAQNDKHILVSENADAKVTVQSGAQPYIVTLNVPTWVQGSAPSEATEKDYDITTTTYKLDVLGAGFSGSTRLVKQGDGILNLPAVEQTYSGSTDVWAGTLNFDGSMPNSRVWLNRFAVLNSKGTFGKAIEMDYASELRPAGKDVKGTVAADSLILNFGSRVVFDVYSSDMTSDVVKANVLNIEKKDWKNGPEYSTPVFQIDAHLLSGSKKLPAGKYLLGEIGKIDGDIKNIVVEGLDFNKFALAYEDGKLYLDVKNSREQADVTWIGDKSGTWDNQETDNFYNGATGKSDVFVQLDNVVIDDNAKTTNIVLEGKQAPNSLTFANNEKNIVITGDALVGDANVTKNGSGTVTLNNANKYSGTTTINGGKVIVGSLASNIGIDYGALGGVDNVVSISNKATLAVNESMSLSQPLMIGNGGAAIEVASGKTLEVDSKVSKATANSVALVKNGAGLLKLNGATVAYDSLIVNSGTVYDFGDVHFSGKTIVLNGGTLQYNNSIYGDFTDNVNLIVPKGKTATFYPDGRCNYTGKLTGEGTLNVYATWVRCPFNGNWSEFTGTIKVYQGAKNTYDPTFDFNNTYGIGKATLNIASDATVYTNGKNFAIGALTGSGTITNTGYWGSSVNTLTIGEKNTDFSFSGKIEGCRVTKKGTGKWTVSSVDVFENAGPITVYGGELRLNNDKVTSSLTGVNPLQIQNGGALTGKGITQSVYAYEGSVIRPGVGSVETSNAGCLKTLGNVVANAGSSICLNRSSAAEYNTKTGAIMYSYLEVGGTLTVNGTIRYTYKGWVPAAGDVVTLFVANEFVGNPSFDLQELPAGLAWDTSEVMTTGKLKVVAATSVNKIAANDEVECSVITLAGVKVAEFKSTKANVEAAAKAAGLECGSYIVSMKSASAVENIKLLIK
ncbi:autotransporter-associated beta strand repeat-containing protein [Bacteroidales bacterium KHT7]|nr:autotransporter-associated beta strand repeat-containing protein [Bacteroidales bacterium KHT7]